MDTIVSTQSVAMGHAQQQAVHPFFRQAFGVSPQSNPSAPDTSIVGPQDAFSPETAPTGDSETLTIDKDHSETTQETPQALNPNLPVPLSPEDPNAGRRKRRKTEKPKSSEDDAPLQTGLAGWLGRDLSAPVVAVEAPIAPTSQIAATAPQIHPDSLPSEATSGAAQIISGEAYPDPQPERKRKIVKLNLNGRLLSSPPPTPVEDVTQKRTGGKRGRSRKTESKLAILKYRVNGDKNIAKLVDDILHRRTTYKLASTSRTAPAPPKIIKENKPAKPTHPFFLKKSTQESQPDSIPESKATSECPTPKPLTDYSSRNPPAMKREPWSLSSFHNTPRARTTKFPELVHPLWPPRDFVHVRSVDNPVHDSAFNPSQNDQKKSKVRVISIDDDENTLLVNTRHARKAAASASAEGNAIRPTLRIPVRHIASGRTLQTAIDSQMSWASDRRSMKYSSLPVITNLRSSLLSSFPAFDCGKYESQLWAHKYAPRTAEDVLQVGREAHVLRDWLRHLKITAVDTGKNSKDLARSKAERKKKKKKKQKEKLDGFIVSSGDENSEMDNLSGSDDELAGNVTVSAQKTVIRAGDVARSGSPGEKGRLTNAILLSGPPGSGKTAAVYAVAKELDFEIFEINAGARRSARDMLEKVGDMTQNHLVHLLNENDDAPTKPRAPAPIDESKQNKLMKFFQGKPSNDPVPETKSTKASPKPQTDNKPAREQKQSLILLEEVDILFEEDRQFWTGVMTLISQSRRPIVITCNDESLLPLQNLSLHAILRFQKPVRDLAIDYLLLVAANEGHVLKRDAVGKLFDASGMDVRRSLMDLNFWCQIGVGSDKAGLDWILPCWPPESNIDENGDRKRVLSLNTYESYMGWFNRDLLMSEDHSEKETEALRNTFHWWRLGIQESEDAAGFSEAENVPRDHFYSKSKLEQLELLDREMDYQDMRSSLDVLSSRCQLDMTKDIVDISAPPIPESHRSSYIEAFPLLQASLQPEYTTLSENISLSFDAILSKTFRTRSPDTDMESAYAAQMFNGWRKSATRRHVFPSKLTGFQKVFEPITRYSYTMTISSGRLAPSFENTLSPITEDLAPYIRSIMVFDGRLKQYRDYLSALSNQQNPQGEKKQRNTRASRAALEGGSKASVRKERWFPDDTNYFLVQGTGKPEWQEMLFQMGHFRIQPVFEQPSEEQ